MRVLFCDDERHDPDVIDAVCIRRDSPSFGWDSWSEGDRCPDCVRRFGFSPRPLELRRAEAVAGAVLLPYFGEIA